MINIKVPEHNFLVKKISVKDLILPKPMKRFNYSIFYFLIIIICSCEFSDSNQNKPEDNVPQLNTSIDIANVVSIDTFQNALGQFISGMDCSYFNAESNIDSLYWKDYSSRVNRAFSKMKKNRLEPMREWMMNISSDKVNDTSLLFYPFSGADFLHANYLFPEANDYILLAQEKIGDIPDISSLKNGEYKNYLNAVDLSLSDIYKRSYFITKTMQNDTERGAELNGLLPLFYWFIARTDHEIIDVSRIYVDSFSTVKKNINNSTVAEDLIEGVKFVFRKCGAEKIKTMTYFNCDISNKGFAKNPEFKKYLTLIRASNSFVKSASYLMHYSTFSEIRDLLQQKSNAILEDDTGIPYKYFNTLEWDVNLFGVYVMPIKDFSETRFQQDLEDAYSDDAQYKGEMPFSLGYHWSSRKQNQMLYIKK